MVNLRFNLLLLWKISFALIGIVSFFTLTGFFGRIWWFFELTSHFRIQYFAVLLFFTIITVIGKRKKQTAVAAVFGLINFALVIPYGFTSATAQANNPSIKAL